ncbi:MULTISPECIES: hypothetical protein [Rhizobium/Agrobacterium group]|uniref:Uncharacterized protein n=1 Tax=Agrobacterium pusense TaxID=648995 RepID=A0A6H0ZKS5_9HYPH|nr:MULTISPECIES: hypothetical protein [Rhizobium/Agrobacterium group]QIX20763.1 hypothetical protein FOB41_06275 [Agrobacterium pusense]WCK22730.1 hypothetical protein CFBP5496_0008155 [Agrobacterium pusense]CAD7058697.1 hypothetical protein RP007_05877 [Rhizobium sp. P007]
MDNWLKALVACACVVIISGGGYYAYSQYAETRAHSLEQARLENVRDGLFRDAEAAKNDVEAVKKYCRAAQTSQTLSALADKRDLYRQIEENCRYFGYL